MRHIWADADQNTQSKVCRILQWLEREGRLHRVDYVLLTEFDAELHDKVAFEAGKTEGEVKSLAKLVADGLIPLNAAVSRLNFSEKVFIQQALMLDISIKR